ncbi:MAG: hypothetical protein M3290_12415, partial [Actinomycetota bacterium]|nr:hypothetical protein [Actinomycetota bacterium]
MTRLVSDPLGFVVRETGRGARELWEHFRLVTAALLGAVIVVAILPVAAASTLQISSLAAGLCIVLAAIGLNFAVGLAGVPSLGQGGFVGIGAFVAAWLAVR